MFSNFSKRFIGELKCCSKEINKANLMVAHM